MVDFAELCQKSRSRVLNTFKERDVRNYKSIFSIKSDDDLDDFWLYMSNFNDLQKGEVFGFISSLYFFFDYLKSDKDLEDRDKTIDFIIEENDENFYWTTNSQYLIFLTNNQNIFFGEFEFKNSGGLLTFELSKYGNYSDNGAKRKKVYSFIPKEILLQLQEISEELSSKLLEISVAYEFNRSVIERLIDATRRFVNIIKNYDEIISMSDRLDDFVIFMNSNIEDIVDFEIEEIELFEQLFSNLNRWLLLSFFTGIEDIEDLNPLIKENISSITEKVVERHQEI